MTLNYIWIAFFIIGFIIALYKLIFLGELDIFDKMVNSTFEMSKTGFEISLGLTGVLTFWMGLLKVGERAGLVEILSKLVGPFFTRLFPTVPKDHPVMGTMMMNFAANMLGLDNAATPMGLKAMKELQSLNHSDDTASDAQILFLVINTAGLTIIPMSILVYRIQFHSTNPAVVFLPLLLATFCATFLGLLFTSFYQKINLWNKVVLSYLLGFMALIAGIFFVFNGMDKASISLYAGLIGNLTLFTVIILFILMAVRKRVNVYDSFIDGGKEGFGIAITIIPYLIAILVAIGVFRTSGAMDSVLGIMSDLVVFFGLDPQFVPALPTALLKPLSGAGARGMMLDVFNNPALGVDSFAGKLASIFQGSSDTTFYILAVYFGSVNIKNTRHAVKCGLFADFASIIISIVVAYMFF